ncbi:MAG: hypothetical protein HQ567_30230 [Candidatus Nealsonbacteria bacterium]|nr:hypothetical protein [Candidatus Nealsonbacteria bacterium]
MDVMMPKKSGLVLFKQLKKDERYRDIPVLMVTGTSEILDEMDRRDEGSEKPLNRQREALKKAMREMREQGLFGSGLVVVPGCASCHGSHGIYYAADKRSTLHKSTVATTCGKCRDEIEHRLPPRAPPAGSRTGRFPISSRSIGVVTATRPVHQRLSRNSEP